MVRGTGSSLPGPSSETSKKGPTRPLSAPPGRPERCILRSFWSALWHSRAAPSYLLHAFSLYQALFHPLSVCFFSMYGMKT